MGIGISFGSKKNTTTGKSNIDKTVDSVQSQTGSSTQSGTTTQTGVQNTTQNQAGKTSQLGTQDQTQQGTTTGRQTGTTTTLGADVQGALSDRVKALLGSGVSDQNISALSEMISGREMLDVDTLVSQAVGAARNRGEQTLQEQNSAFGNRAGGSSTTNSMAALLAQRGRNDLEASLAGVAADTRLKAESVVNDQINTAAGAQGAVAGIAGQLAGVLKGAETTVDMTTLADEISKLTGKTGQIAANTSTGTQSTESSNTTQQLLNMIQSLVSRGSEHTVGSESMTQQNKSGGFGLSLGL